MAVTGTTPEAPPPPPAPAGVETSLPRRRHGQGGRRDGARDADSPRRDCRGPPEPRLHHGAPGPARGGPDRARCHGREREHRRANRRRVRRVPPLVRGSGAVVLGDRPDQRRRRAARPGAARDAPRRGRRAVRVGADAEPAHGTAVLQPRDRQQRLLRVRGGFPRRAVAAGGAGARDRGDCRSGLGRQGGGLHHGPDDRGRRPVLPRPRGDRRPARASIPRSPA